MGLLPLLLGAIGASSGSIQITEGPTILWANVGQLQRVTVRGSGFVVGSSLSCRVVDAPYDGTNFCPYCKSPAEIPRPAHVINTTAASCLVAGSASGILEGGGSSPGYAAGSGVLQFNDSSKYGWPKNTAPWSWPLDFQPLADIAVGRRPYFSNETEAELIVLLGAAVDQPVHICATIQRSPAAPLALPCATVRPTRDGRGTAVPFSLRELPSTINTTVAVNFSTLDGQWSGGPIVRRLVRVASPSLSGSDGAAVVVDPCHRALRIDGEIFIGKGFYWPNTKTLSLAQQEQWMFYLSQQVKRAAPLQL